MSRQITPAIVDAQMGVAMIRDRSRTLEAKAETIRRKRIRRAKAGFPAGRRKGLPAARAFLALAFGMEG